MRGYFRVVELALAARLKFWLKLPMAVMLLCSLLTADSKL
jgi:hypothetical protein